MKKEIEISAPKGYSFKELRDGKVVFEQDVLPTSLPTSWEEYCDNSPITAEECCVEAFGDIHVVKNEETAKAFLALNKLIHLRDCYRQGWVPNWRDVNEWKCCIVVYHNDVCRDVTHTHQQILSFQTFDVRDMFLANFRDLIEQAKELL